MMGKPLRASRSSKKKAEPGNQDDHGRDSLVLMAFSDYGGRDVTTLLDFAQRLEPPPDLLLYGGDAACSRQKMAIGDLKRLATATKYSICAVAGGLRPSGTTLRGRRALARDPVHRVVGRSRSGEVQNIHEAPIVIGNYAVLGGAACAPKSSPQRREPGFAARLSFRHLHHAAAAVAGRHVTVLSHAPPEGTLDRDCQCSCPPDPRVLRQFVLNRRDVPLIVCGCAGFCGGESRKLGRSLVVNVASRNDMGQPGRVALIELRDGKVVGVKWTLLWELDSIPGVNQAHKESLEKIGVRTPRDLAGASNDQIARAIQGGKSEAMRLRAHALAFFQQEIVVLRSFSLPSRNRAYLTFEKCSMTDDIRLLGLHLETENRTTIFLAETPEKEKHILIELLRLLSPLSRASLICYSGSLWQQQLLSRRLACHGLPTRITQYMKDIFFDIENCLALPTRHLGLREVAACCGFKWQDASLTDYDAVPVCGTSLWLTNAEKRSLRKRSAEDLVALRYIVQYLERVLRSRTPVAL